jgi:hypothetical protein
VFSIFGWSSKSIAASVCAAKYPFGYDELEQQGVNSQKLLELTRWLRDNPAPILSIAVSRNGKIVYELYTSGVDREAAQGDLCHEAPALPVTRPSRSLASRSIDNFLGGFFLHKCFAPSGRTAKCGHSCAADRGIGAASQFLGCRSEVAGLAA